MKLDFNKLTGKIKLIDTDKKEWIGTVYGFTPKFDNPEGKDSLDLKIKDEVYIFFDDEIKSIQYIE